MGGGYIRSNIMGEYDVGASVVSDLTNANVTAFSVDPSTTDGPTDLKETTWMNNDFGQYLGYYDTIPELAAVYDAKAAWTVGRGFRADPDTTFVLNGIRGIGGDSFNPIIENMIRTYQIGGNAYSEIIRDKRKEFTNLKPLDPAVMKHVANPEGVIIRFEQTAKSGKNKGKVLRKFTPEEIFYLPRNRVADNIHGNTMTTRLATIILAKNEAMADQKIMYHRFVKPRWIIKLDTDVPSEVAAEKTKWDSANDLGENMYLPMGSVEVEQMTIAPNSTLNPQAMIESLDAKFYEAAQVPKIVVGGTGGFTDAAVKTSYLAYEQNIRSEKLFVEEQIGLQLGIELEFIFPASLMNDMLSDEAKDGSQAQQLNKPSEVPNQEPVQ